MNIRVLDTASLYGESEVILGRAMAKLNSSDFRIVTKTVSMAASESITGPDVFRLQSALIQSAQRLGKPLLDTVLIHHSSDLVKPGGEKLMDALNAQKASGRIRRIGVSLLSLAHFAEIDARMRPDVIQLPLNILDQRACHHLALRNFRRRGGEVHVRSVFLQGLLLMDPNRLPAFVSGEDCRKLMSLRSVLRQEQVTAIEACLAFVWQSRIADVGIVGVTSRKELLQVQYAWDRREQVAEILSGQWKKWASDSEIVMTPALWPTWRAK
jgi:aryl-alcohol dehydrogenase-like predicted oxidoreductase